LRAKAVLLISGNLRTLSLLSLLFLRMCEIVRLGKYGNVRFVYYVCVCGCNSGIAAKIQVLDQGHEAECERLICVVLWYLFEVIGAVKYKKLTRL